MTSLTSEELLGQAKKEADLVEFHRNEMSKAAARRKEAIQESVNTGTSVVDVASALGITRQQVYRLIKD